MADEGDAPAQQRLDDLTTFRADLQAVAAGRPHSGRWPQVFEPLSQMIPAFRLPTALLEDLLDAFVQDVIKTRDRAGYANLEELLDYCRRSANPVGRLLLHLHGVEDSAALGMSDAICSALQLINFWQDLSVDIPRGRHYLPRQDCTTHQVNQADLTALRQTEGATNLIADHTRYARTLMLQGAPLVKCIPGRAGWELRLVVQGGLRILDKIEALQHATLNTRPRLRAWDAPLMLWRAVWM
jgi:squalene synthase HpnC